MYENAVTTADIFISFLPLTLLSAGFIYYGFVYSKYRNLSARHDHRVDTKSKMLNLRNLDNPIKRLTNLTNKRIARENKNCSRDIAVRYIDYQEKEAEEERQKATCTNCGESVHLFQVVCLKCKTPRPQKS
jgi:hypothetical protein